MLQNAGTIFTAVDITHSIPFIIHHCLQGKGSSQNRLCGAFRTLRQMFHVSQARLLGDGPIRSCKRSTHQSRCLPPNPQSLQWSIRLIQPLLCTCMCCHPNALEKRFMRPSQSPLSAPATQELAVKPTQSGEVKGSPCPSPASMVTIPMKPDDYLSCAHFLERKVFVESSWPRYCWWNGHFYSSLC